MRTKRSLVGSLPVIGAVVMSGCVPGQPESDHGVVSGKADGTGAQFLRYKEVPTSCDNCGALLETVNLEEYAAVDFSNFSAMRLDEVSVRELLRAAGDVSASLVVLGTLEEVGGRLDVKVQDAWKSASNIQPEGKFWRVTGTDGVDGPVDAQLANTVLASESVLLDLDALDLASATWEELHKALLGGPGIIVTGVRSADRLRVQQVYLKVPAAAGCRGSEDCSSAEYCELPLEAACGRGAEVSGTCRRRPGTCEVPPQPSPDLVCGCDGMTYDSPCLAQLYGQSVSHAGVCVRWENYHACPAAGGCGRPCFVCPPDEPGCTEPEVETYWKYCNSFGVCLPEYPVCQ